MIMPTLILLSIYTSVTVGMGGLSLCWLALRERTLIRFIALGIPGCILIAVSLFLGTFIVSRLA